MILEAFENNIAQIFNRKQRDKHMKLCEDLIEFEKVTESFVELIKHERSKAIASLLGFKLQALLASRSPPPLPLLLVICLLLKHDLIQIENIWPYLTRQVKVGDEFIAAPDEVVEYHSELLKFLNKKYQALEKNILDQSYKS